MQVCVTGLWHLGCVTAACLAKMGIKVIGAADSAAAAARLCAGHAPVYEPGLDDLIASGIASGALQFTEKMEEAVRSSDYVWVCYDTPVDNDDHADEESVLQAVRGICGFLESGQGMLISSQLPVGATAGIEDYFMQKRGKKLMAAYVPENLRLGKAIDVFCSPDRIVAGVRDEECRKFFQPLLSAISSRLVWMGIESAEMTKHAVNGFLATSVAYINEIAEVCEMVGADAGEVSRGLLSEERIGNKAYLRPGSAFSGGTLARDIAYLIEKADLYRGGAGEAIPQIRATKESNDRHKKWAYHMARKLFGSLAGKRILVLGLTYKEDTDTLRRSLALELIHDLAADGAAVTAYDAHIQEQPQEEAGKWKITRMPVQEAEQTDCLIIARNSEEYKQMGILEALKKSEGAAVIDENGCFSGQVLPERIRYCTVGKVVG